MEDLKLIPETIVENEEMVGMLSNERLVKTLLVGGAVIAIGISAKVVYDKMKTKKNDHENMKAHKPYHEDLEGEDDSPTEDSDEL